MPAIVEHVHLPFHNLTLPPHLQLISSNSMNMIENVEKVDFPLVPHLYIVEEIQITFHLLLETLMM